MLQKFLRCEEVAGLTGLSRSSIYVLIGRDEFPKPVPLGIKGVAWLENEVLEWQRARIADRDKKAAA